MLYICERKKSARIELQTPTPTNADIPPDTPMLIITEIHVTSKL